MAKNKPAKMKNGAFDMSGESNPADDMGMMDSSTADDTSSGADVGGETDTGSYEGNTISVTTSDIPELDGMQVGDTITVTAEGTITKAEGKNYEIKLDVFKPSDVGMSSSGASGDAGASAGAAAGGLAGLLGGKGA